MKKKLFILILCAITLLFVMSHYVIIPERNYKEAVMLMEQGAYAEASVLFAELGNYRDAENRIYEPYYLQGNQLYATGSFEQAITSFEQANGFKDSELLISECKYQKAKQFVQEGHYEEALSLYIDILDYKNVTQILDENSFLNSAVQSYYCDIFFVGNEILFGNYEQDGNNQNGKEPIEWIVLSREGSNALLLSKYALDARKYHNEDTSITWEDCELRQWLNSDFFYAAFTTEERVAISTSQLSNDALKGNIGEGWSAKSGNETFDNVFLLSYEETSTLLRTKASRVCEVTEYAKSEKGGSVWEDEEWWLRSSGHSNSYAASVSYDGRIVGNSNVCDDGTNRIPVSRFRNYVRPAIWVSLQTDALLDTVVTLYATEGSILSATDEAKKNNAYDPFSYYPEFDGTCVLSHCDHKARDGKLYCWTHACCREDCFNSKDPATHCCSTHNCAHDGCGMHRYEYIGSKYCQVHYDEH